jgi:hypothetical protein
VVDLNRYRFSAPIEAPAPHFLEFLGKRTMHFFLWRPGARFAVIRTCVCAVHLKTCRLRGRETHADRLQIKRFKRVVCPRMQG